tara:strand:- start:312 stop:434 length:123 start_codon:yes stop_codon:yes gene_type:complete
MYFFDLKTFDNNKININKLKIRNNEDIALASITLKNAENR